MTKKELKALVARIIDGRAEDIIRIGESILARPEMGYREVETARLVRQELEKLSIPYRDGLALSGVRGEICGREHRARVAVIGEMDAVVCALHPSADVVSGAAHACGHHAQIASMLGCAMGLSAIAGELDGDVSLLAVPAEEFVEIEYRARLRERGDITLLGGKQELIALGEFDNVDMAMMVHAKGNAPAGAVYPVGPGMGFVAKKINFIGKAAHAGGAPHEGINALNAAMAAMMCIHAARETFRDEDKIRVHPIITNGGELVNVVPDLVTMETYVRGATPEAVRDASEKVDRAIRGASMAIGAECEIIDYKGYLPLAQSEALMAAFTQNAEEAGIPVIPGFDMTGSTDMGDLGHIMPVIQPCMGGFHGNLHAADFSVADKWAAYVLPAKLMAMTVIDLLADGAEGALAIKREFIPKMTKEEYLAY
ncbi:MAG: amidohydrolase [Clostridia bacterium]|nr:amidohydrolase [Clostridia bacterium]